MKNSEIKEKRGAPLRMKLFWILAAFCVFIIAILWVLQVVLMDGFYQSVTVVKMNRHSHDIEMAIKNDGDVRAAAYNAAESSGACVSVYMIKGGTGMKVADAHVKNGCFVHDLIADGDLNRIYSEAQNSNGSFSGKIGTGNESEDEGSILVANIIDHGGVSYMLLFGTESFPVGTMSSTVTVQLVMITVILIVGAGVLAVIISRKITRPVSELCSEAERLAVGDYSVNFSSCAVDELNRLGDTLKYAAAELERSDRLQRELIANITHDLRTPLTMISGYSEVMRDIPGEVTPENLQVIIDESARLSALVSDVLEVSKAQNKAMVLNLAPIPITDVVRATVTRYGTMLKDKGYTLRFESDGTSAVTVGDETKLVQALCNLINNGVNFTGEDKIVTVRQTVNNGVCRIEVSDTGKGIPADELESIWDRYYRARDFQNKGIAGSGLGLAIVKNILILHGASFGVESAVGVGSTFWFEVKTQ